MLLDSEMRLANFLFVANSIAGMKSKTLLVIFLTVLAGVFWQGFSAATKSAPTKSKLLAKSNTPGLTLREISGERILLEWVAPTMHPIADSAAGAVTEVVMEGTTPVYEPGVIGLPGISELLDALPGPATVTLIEPEYESFSLGECLPAPEDYVVDPRITTDDAEKIQQIEDDAKLTLNERRLRTEKRSELWPQRIVELSESGTYRGHRLLSLNLRPVQINTLTGEGRYLKYAKIQVIRPNSSNNEIRLPDRTSETRQLRNMLGLLAESALPTRAMDVRETRQHNQLDDNDFPVYNVNAWRIYVQETSIIRLNGEYMRRMGVPLEQITPWDLHIYNKGREIPIVVEGQADGRFDEFDYIDFFGERNERTYLHLEPSLYQDPYSAVNCYQLYWGDGRPGLRMGEENGSWQPTWNAEIVRSVRVKEHFENDRKFDRLGDAPDFLGGKLNKVGPLGLIQDNWFWGERIDALTSRNFDQFISYPNPNPPFSFEPVIVRACLTGFSSNPGFNHYVTVSLNGLTDRGLTVGKQNSSDTAAAWVGQTPVIFQTKLVDSVSNNIQTEDLVHGINTFTVTVPGNALAGNADKVFVNWFEVEYERDMRSRQGAFRFDFNQPLRDTVGYDIRGFATSNVQVWKLGQSRLTSLEVRRVTPADESASYAVHFPLISDAPHDVLVWGENYVFPPFSMSPDTVAMDLRNNPGAEYVIIAYDPFYSDTAVHMLDSMRRITFDNSVLTVPLSEVYEQFSGGLITPNAIRDFLTYAYDHWQVRPTHCCLIGDAVLEQREGSIPGNQIPSFSPPTLLFGSATADYLMGCVSGDPWDIIPDIAIGRISSRNPQELQTYVAKVLKYERVRDYEGLFQSNILMISDTFDQRFNFVSGFSEPAIRELLTSVDNCVNVSRLYLDSIPAGQGPIRLRDELRNGCVLVNYNGHGGGGVWSGSRLIDVTGVRLLNNRETFPFITNFTCYVGAFDDRSQAAVLGEAFLFTRNNNNDLIGASGFYSSSGVGWAEAGRLMQRQLFDFVMERPSRTIGEIATINKARFWSFYNQPISFTSNYSMMMMMNLLGDPGLKLATPQDDINPELIGESNVIHPRDSLNPDSVRVRIVLPWDPEELGSTETRAYVLPYNGELYTYRMVGNPPRLVATLATTHSPAFDIDALDFSPCESRICTTNAVGLPSFVSPRGTVVVYVTDPLLERNAIGCFPIFLKDSLENVQIFDVTPIPGPVAFSNVPFRIGATILHENDVQSVRFRGIYTPAQGPVLLDTLSMVQTETGQWQVPRQLGPYDFDGGSYRMKFFVTPFGETEFESDYYNLSLEINPDFNLTLIQGSVPGERGGRRPYYYQPVRIQRSSSTRDIEDVLFRLTAVHDSTYVVEGDTVRAVLDSFSVDHLVSSLGFGESEQGVYIPTSFRPGRYNVSVVVDPENQYRESREDNNRRDVVLNMPSYYPATQTRGTYLDRPLQIGPHIYPSTSGDDTLYVRIPPSVLTRDSVAIAYTQPRVLSATDSTTLVSKGLRQPFSTTSKGVFKAMIEDTLVSLGDNFSAFVTLTYQARDTMRARLDVLPMGLYVRDPSQEQWLIATGATITREPIDTVRVGADTLVTWRLTASGTVPYLGEFGIFRRGDLQGPTIEIAVGGLRFTQGAIVPRNPQIFATFSDIAGVQRGDGFFHIVLDDDTVRDDQITWNDTVFTSSSMTAMFEPDLEPGPHSLTVLASDDHGNTSEYTANFEVRGNFGFEWAINYPNPFAQNTTISYVLTGATDDFTQIKIYTVSGRLIRTLRDNERTTANYRTQQWDGRDDKGEEVANGVYFAKIIAKQADETIEEVVKLAKVRK
jgi:hypothetical protein